MTYSLTTPLYYVNAKPHLGSTYTTIACDALARFQRLEGNAVVFITGVDEHGQKIQRTAESQQISPQDHCDLISRQYTQLWSDWGISNDRFVRTTSERHLPLVQEFFRRCEPLVTSAQATRRVGTALIARNSRMIPLMRNHLSVRSIASPWNGAMKRTCSSACRSFRNRSNPSSLNRDLSPQAVASAKWRTSWPAAYATFQSPASTCRGVCQYQDIQAIPFMCGSMLCSGT